METDISVIRAIVEDVLSQESFYAGLLLGLALGFSLWKFRFAKRTFERCD